MFNPNVPPVPNKFPIVSVFRARLNRVLNVALAPGLTLNDWTLELPVIVHWLVPSIVRLAPGASSGFTRPVSVLPSERLTVV